MLFKTRQISIYEKIALLETIDLMILSNAFFLNCSLE